jgi:hypothetical protein
MHSFSHAHCLAAGRGRRSCLALYGSASGSGLRSPYASSPMHQAVSCSTLLYLWTGSSSPVASHPAFRRRSFLRLRTASVLSDGDFHPTVGAHSQAHVGTRSARSDIARLHGLTGFNTEDEHDDEDEDDSKFRHLGLTRLNRSSKRRRASSLCASQVTVDQVPPSRGREPVQQRTVHRLAPRAAVAQGDAVLFCLEGLR